MDQALRNNFLNEHKHYKNLIKSFQHVTLTWFLNSKEEKQRCSLLSQECRGSPLQLSYFLAEVIQLFVARQLC